MRSTSCSGSSTEGPLIHDRRAQIEQQIIVQGRQDTTAGSLLDKVIAFQEKFIAFQDLLIETAGLYLIFWKELLKESPGTTLTTSTAIGYNCLLYTSDAADE